jgi:Domain of unknown function (DUF4157)
MPFAPRSVEGSASPAAVKRTAASRAGRERALSRRPSQVSPVSCALDGSLRSPGVPLPEATRRTMEASFGRDFSAVRVHDDVRAAAAAAELDAAAFTIGQDVVFAAGRYTPSTAAGLRLLGHELAHTVQQRDARKEAAPVPPGSTFEAQADAAGAQAAAGGRVTTPLTSSPLAVARQPPRLPVPFTEPDVDVLVGRIGTTAEPVGKGFRTFASVTMDIDEPVAVSRGGAWDDPANKRFLESTTNRLTKNALVESAPPGPTGTISLRAAKAQGPAAFRAAAYAMLNRNFSDVVELAAVTREARAAMRNLNRPVPALRDAINESIRGRIERAATPDAKLVNEALRVIGVDPEGLSVRPLEGSGPVGQSVVGAPRVTAPPQGPRSPSETTAPAREAPTTTTEPVRGLVEGRGEPPSPIAEPYAASQSAKGGVEGAGGLILSGLLQAAQGAEKQKALDKLATLAQKISGLRHSGYGVTIRLEVEQPDAPDIMAGLTGTGDAGQTVYYHDLFISGVVKKSLAPPPSRPSDASSMSPAGEADYSRPAWYVKQKVHPQHHIVSGELTLPALSPFGGTYRPTAVRTLSQPAGALSRSLAAFGMQRTLVIHGEDDEFAMYDDDARASWKSEMPSLRQPLGVAAIPGEVVTRFRRTTQPTYSVESRWLPTTIDSAAGKVQGFSEAVIGRSEEPGAPTGSAFAMFTWAKISD